MLGDLMIWLSVFFEQHFICYHDYKRKVTRTYGEIHFWECSKCGRLRDHVIIREDD